VRGGAGVGASVKRKRPPNVRGRTIIAGKRGFAQTQVLGKDIGDNSCGAIRGRVLEEPGGCKV